MKWYVTVELKEWALISEQDFNCEQQSLKKWQRKDTNAKGALTDGNQVSLCIFATHF